MQAIRTGWSAPLLFANPQRQVFLDRFSCVEAQIVRAKENLRLSHGGPSQRQASACADPWIFARGVQFRLPDNSSDNSFFFFFFILFFLSFFLSPQLILQFDRGCPMVISKKTIFSKVSEGVQCFPGKGGSKC